MVILTIAHKKGIFIYLFIIDIKYNVLTAHKLGKIRSYLCQVSYWSQKEVWAKKLENKSWEWFSKTLFCLKIFRSTLSPIGWSARDLLLSSNAKLQLTLGMYYHTNHTHTASQYLETLTTLSKLLYS